MRLLLPLVLLLGACAEQATTPAVTAEAFELPADQVMFGVSHKMIVDGVVTAILNADTAFVHEQSRHLDLLGVTVHFKTEHGADAGTLTSHTGYYDNGSRLFVARGNVVLITVGPDGERHLETEELYYNLPTDELWTDYAFTLIEDGRVSRGTSFRTDSNFTTWEVTGIQTHGRVGSDGGLRF